MLSDKRIKEIVLEVEETKAELETVVGAIKDNQEIRIDAIKQLEEFEIKTHEFQMKRAAAQQEIVENNFRADELRNQINQLESALKDDAHEKSVREMVAQQTSFHDALKSRFESHQAELNGGLELPNNEKSFEAFLSIFERKGRNGAPSFNQETVLFNSTRHQYEEALFQICEKSILGKEITANDKRQRLSVLDNFLLDPKVERCWA